MNISKLHFTFNDKRCIICVNENLINKYRDRLDFTIYIYKGGSDMLFKKDINKKIEHLVKKNDFYAVADYVYGTKEEKLDLAKALGTNDNNSSVDLLLRLVDDKDDDVVYAACEALRNVGSEHNTADLLEKLNNLPKEKEHLREEISRTVQELHHRN